MKQQEQHILVHINQLLMLTVSRLLLLGRQARWLVGRQGPTYAGLLSYHRRRAVSLFVCSRSMVVLLGMCSLAGSGSDD